MTVIHAPGTRTGGLSHGWLGCCVTHDEQAEARADRESDAARVIACEECGASCPPGAGRYQPDDPQSFLCILCERLAEEQIRLAAIEDDYDWLAER